MNSLFKISAKNHAGMILMTMLAESNDPEVFVSLQEIANRMGLSQGYLEEIALALKKAKLIKGRKGRAGGYQLAKPASQITAEQILVALEGPISPMSCEGGMCPVAAECQSKSLWNFLYKDLIKSLRQTTLKQIITL